MQHNVIDTMLVAEQRTAKCQLRLVEFSLFGLPIQTQAVYSVLVMIPVGAIVMLVIRNVIGVSTFGTFVPGAGRACIPGNATDRRHRAVYTDRDARPYGAGSTSSSSAEAIKEGLGSLLVAAVAYLVMDIDLLENLVFVYPELLLVVLVVLVVLAGSLLLGRYNGYRLLELIRFRALSKTIG